MTDGPDERSAGTARHRGADVERKYDLYSHATMADPHPVYRAMREHDPVLRQRSLEGSVDIWFLTRYEDVEAGLRDPRLVRDPALAGHDSVEMPEVFRLVDNHMLNRDGDEHRRLRTLVQMAFTPKRVAALRPRIEAIAHELLDGVVARGRMDLVSDFAFELPTIVILEMLGVPVEDRAKFRAWANAFVEPRFDPEGLAEHAKDLGAFVAYLRALFERRRDDPRDDLLTGLLQARAEGGSDGLTDDELLGTMALLIVAGHETTVNLIANAVRTLLQHPEQLGAAREHPDTIPEVVEEVLRYEGSVERALNRWAAADIEVRGHTIRRGDPVILILASANRDPSAIERPDAFDPSRGRCPHLAFGKGPHYCLGAPLARLEGEVALRAILARLPGLRANADLDALRWRMLPGFRAMEALPIAWDPPA